MAKQNDNLKSEMITRINEGGAWFSTRENNYLKIGRSGEGLCARACVIRDGELTGSAYTFGTDWFDISFHGRLTDIYVDPDTLRKWDFRYDPERGTVYDSAEGTTPPLQLTEFCRQADQEALQGVKDAFHIDGAGFASELTPSEAKMGRTRDIHSIVDF